MVNAIAIKAIAVFENTFINILRRVYLVESYFVTDVTNASFCSIYFYSMSNRNLSIDMVKS